MIRTRTYLLGASPPNPETGPRGTANGAVPLRRGGGPPSPPYFVVFLALIGLTALAFALSFARLGDAAVPIALGVACVKAGLIGAFFMQLAEHRRPYWIFLLAGALLLAALVALVALDVVKREPRRAPRVTPWRSDPTRSSRRSGAEAWGSSTARGERTAAM